MIHASELSESIIIQEDSGTTYNTLNERVPNWANVTTEHASVKETGSRELYFAQKVYAETTAVFKIWFRTDIDSKMRILYGSRVFQILGTPIDPDKKRMELLISAKEVV